jgi:hypothetical protein
MVGHTLQLIGRPWFVGLLALGSCDAYAPKPEASSPVASAAAPAVPGASDPAECKDQAPPLVGNKWVVSDAMLAKLAPCMKKLSRGGRVSLSVITSDTGGIERVNVLASGVGDCAAITCLKARLSKLRVAKAEPPHRKEHSVTLQLLPGKSPQNAAREDPSPASSENYSCIDPKDPELQAARLPPEVIQSAVRSRYDAFRRCYEAGLALNPQLTGKVVTRFVIGLDGRVSKSYVQDNTLPDCGVAHCIRDEIAKIVFPEPKLGIVTVVYPIMLAP